MQQNPRTSCNWGSRLRRKALAPALIFVLTTIFCVQPLMAFNNDDFGKPRREFSSAAKLIGQFMRRHLSNRRLNDEIAKRAMNMYIKNLDPMKMYFVQSDIDEFTMIADEIDDSFRKGKFDIAFLVFKRFIKRVDERTADVPDIVTAEHDFTIDEDMMTDRDEIKYAQNAEEIRDRWRKRIKYNLLLYETEETPSSKDPKERLIQRYKSTANRLHNYRNEDVIEVYISAITTSFDPHTSYMSRSTFESFEINMKLELEGIGATLQSTDDGLTVIRRIVPDGAADKQGDLKVEDKIVAVAQAEGEKVDIMDMKLDDVVDMIRGKAGTVVKLDVLSPGSNEINTITIVREKVQLKDSAAQGTVFEAGEKTDGSMYKIGVIDLPSFYSDMSGSRGAESRSTTRDVAKILDGFRAQGVDSVILDLRRNGGGSLREAIDCTGLFIDTGPVVQVKDFLGNLETFNDKKAGAGWSGPLVIMTSKFSASASEILAGAVQDYNRGLVVGDTTTHGKGTVQTLVDLGEEFLRVPNAPKIYGALKLTIQQFYRPNGDSTQQRGVLADIVLPSISDHMDVSESDLDYPVDFDQVPSAQFRPLGLVPSEVVSDLRGKSSARVDESKDFGKVSKQIKRYLEQKKAKKVSLNREAFNARRKEFDADKSDKDTIEEQMNPNTDIKRDFYMEEVISIARDYLKAMEKKVVQNR